MRDGASTEEQPVAEQLSESGRLMAVVLEAERVLWR
jgi:hypothetical protein